VHALDLQAVLRDTHTHTHTAARPLLSSTALYYDLVSSVDFFLIFTDLCCVVCKLFIAVSVSLQCFDTAGWATGRASGL